jgi:uncharacterized protein (TIRG00374 family)
VWLISRIDPNDILQNLLQSKWGYFLGGGGVLLLINIVLAFRWKILLDVGDNRLSWFILLQLYLVGGFFNAFLPTGLGGDVMRVRLSGNSNVSFRQACLPVEMDVG